MLFFAFLLFMIFKELQNLVALCPAPTCNKEPKSTDLFVKGKEVVIIGYTDCILALQVSFYKIFLIVKTL